MARYKMAKRPPPEIGLFMECEDDELSPAQKGFFSKIKKDNQKFKKKMNDYLEKLQGEVKVEEGDCFLFQIKHGLPASTQPKTTPIVGQTIPTTPSIARVSRLASTPAASPQQKSVVVKPGVRRRGRPPTISSQMQQILNTPPPKPPLRSKSVDKPSESTAAGGLTVGAKPIPRIFPVVHNEADSEEVSVPKVVGKTYPSLTVSVKPQLPQNLRLLANQAATERANLDVQVKGVLMFSAGKFTEWLIQQGLIRSEQNCAIHLIPRKLGMYNDLTKFPYSGGYVWISDCCPTDFMSVYYGSILEGSYYIPNVTLKLIYHWACQTNIANIITWVKVNSIHIKEMFSLLRATCALAIHEKFGMLGGPGKQVQVGIISLGSVHLSSKNSRVDVLGVMDVETSKFRLLAVDWNQKERRTGSLGAISAWVDKNSIICIDYGVLTTDITKLGFYNVQQNYDATKKIVEYMKKAVPKLFQNSLPLLSKKIIQQFLDELVWREQWGAIPAFAYNCMMQHLAEFTQNSTVERILTRLKKIAQDPFCFVNKLAISAASEAAMIDSGPSVVSPKRSLKRSIDTAVAAAPPPTKKMLTVALTRTGEKPHSYWKLQPDSSVNPEITNFINSNNTISIESYYYGHLLGDQNKIVDRKPANQVAIKCCVCSRKFSEISDNLILMKHLLLHCQKKPVLTGPLRKAHQCQLCFIGFPTLAGLRNHQNDVHSPSAEMKDRICMICEKIFSDKIQLVYHLHKTHVQSELPYHCQVCGYRTSWYTALVEHFVQSHSGGHHLLCPYCLMTVSLTREDDPILSNLVFYTNHVQRHLRNTDNNCHRCRLRFVSASQLLRHLEKDHASLHLNSNVSPFTSVCTTMMPKPGALIKPAPQPTLRKPERKTGQYSVREFPTPIVALVPDDLACAECENSMASSGHYSGEIKCSKCRFQSYCEAAVAEHFSLWHDGSTHAAFISGIHDNEALPMYCACGFSSNAPNTLAQHLVKCQKHTAYATEAAARDALERLEENEEAEHTVLNVLGLIRNPPEAIMAKAQDPEPEHADETHHPIPPKVMVSKIEENDSNRSAEPTNPTAMEVDSGGFLSGQEPTNNSHSQDQPLEETEVNPERLGMDTAQSSPPRSIHKQNDSTHADSQTLNDNDSNPEGSREKKTEDNAEFEKEIESVEQAGPAPEEARMECENESTIQETAIGQIQFDVSELLSQTEESTEGNSSVKQVSVDHSKNNTLSLECETSLKDQYDVVTGNDCVGDALLRQEENVSDTVKECENSLKDQDDVVTGNKCVATELPLQEELVGDTVKEAPASIEGIELELETEAQKDIEKIDSHTNQSARKGKETEIDTFSEKCEKEELAKGGNGDISKITFLRDEGENQKDDESLGDIKVVCERAIEQTNVQVASDSGTLTSDSISQNQETLESDNQLTSKQCQSRSLQFNSEAFQSAEDVELSDAKNDNGGDISVPNDMVSGNECRTPTCAGPYNEDVGQDDVVVQRQEGVEDARGKGNDAGRLIEELENMMDVDDNVRAGVAETSDFMATFMDTDNTN